MLLQALDIDPELEIASELLLKLRCKKKMKPTFSVLSIQNFIPRVCCWPNEADVYCFKNKAVCSTKLKSDCPKEYCFKLELNNQKKLEFIYYRCNAVYTGKSYKPPAFAYFLAPLLKTAAELRLLEMRSLVRKVYKEVPEEDEASDKYPVFPLDYSDDQTVYAHQQKIDQQNMDMLYQYSVSFSEDVVEKHGDRQPLDNNIHDLSDDLSNASLPPIESVVERQEILRYDILTAKQRPPVPNSTLVAEGSATMTTMTLEEFALYCSTLKEDGKLSDKQFSSTYVSVGISASAKGVNIRDYMISLPNTDEQKAKLLEPICPNVQQSSSILLELDNLPAYKYHDRFKFYRPERGLMVTALQTLETIRNSAQESGKLPHWSLTTASALYWRVKGDAKNAINCLRHAISSSPNEMKDVSLISLANIYYQAGFLNSALTVAGKALDVSPNSVVAVHFTLANIYESLGDLKSASDFYHSTLALQSNFQVAKNRIKEIYCKS
uniref:Tetratricopeptide repeat protein 17 n=1 Tax=Ditylenchus dipsaci TaxID=166011 RepID=A0A915CZI3_9BILA